MRFALPLALLLAALLAAVNAAAVNNYLKIIEPHIKLCTEKHKTTKVDVLKMLVEQKLPETPEMKCTIDCFLAEKGYYKGGKIVWEEMKSSNKDKYVDKPELVEKADKVADICKEKVNLEGKKECEIGVTLLSCLYPESRKIGLPQPEFVKNDLQKSQPLKSQAPDEKTPAEKTPAEKTPAEKTPAEKTPAEKTPAEKTPAEKTPAEKPVKPVGR
uniref:Odorant-binding protein 16 n=1 Tax=Yemma signatus TaxID=300820 RepID=A0A3G2GRT6_9HEMI|nr:odorant-binding protein 16 [Yemma signatus]